MRINAQSTIIVSMLSFAAPVIGGCDGSTNATDTGGDQGTTDDSKESGSSSDPSDKPSNDDDDGSVAESESSSESGSDTDSSEQGTESPETTGDDESSDEGTSSETSTSSSESDDDTDVSEAEESSESSEETTEGTDDETGEEEDTGDDPETDCDNLPSMPVPQDKVKKMNEFKGAEDFTFDKEGYRIRTEDSSGNMFRDDYEGKSTVWIPKVMAGGSWPRGQRMLPNGDMVVVNNKKKLIVRVNTKDKSAKDLAWDLPTPNGIAIGQDGKLYVANKAAIYRIDPDGENSKEEFYKLSGKSFDGISFAPDYKTLYFAEEAGVFHALEIKADGSAGEHKEVTEIRANLDGMAVDECNNAYIADIGVSGAKGGVWRVSPEGKAEKVFNASSTPAVNFGTGIGGWKETSIYVSTFNGGLYEVDVGVRGKKEPHLD